MLGKRFRRTTSMSQIGPHGCCNVKGIHQKQPQITTNQSPCDASVHRTPRPLEVQQPAIHLSQTVEVQAAQLGYVWPEPQLLDHALANPGPSHGVHFHGNLNSNHGFIQDPQHASRIVVHQIGLWAQYNHGGSFGVKMEQDAVPPVVDFLQICHFCKRRLRPERDIFIYRGDTAFCSEECRHRQILCDESESLRAKAKSSDPSSETAVAA